MVSKNTGHRCSFCGRSDKEVQLMITGIDGYICNECVERANEICQDALKTVSQSKLGLDLKTLPKPQEIKDIPRPVCYRSGRSQTVPVCSGV